MRKYFSVKSQRDKGGDLFLIAEKKDLHPICIRARPKIASCLSCSQRYENTARDSSLVIKYPRAKQTCRRKITETR